MVERFTPCGSAGGGYTQVELSGKGIISRAHLIRMEQGRGDPKLSMLFTLADRLGISFGMLTREIEQQVTGQLPLVARAPCSSPGFC